MPLVERHGHIVEKEELIQTVWPETFVEENNLSQYISALRKTLGDGRHEQRYIETVPRRGYRFTGEVREVGGGNEQLIGVSHTRMSLRIQEEIETSDAPLVRPSLMRKLSPRTKAIIATAVLLLLVATFVAASRVRRANTALAARPQIKTLAVLPLKSGSGDDQFLGLGITDDLISRFGQSLDLKIRPTNSIYKYLAKERDAIAAGRDLKVDAVFDGDVQKSGQRLAISIRLFDTRDGKLLWQTKEEGDFKDTMAMRDAIVDRAAGEVFAVAGSSLKTVLAKRSTTNATAYEAYVRGRYHSNSRTAEGLHQSIAFFEQAITLDPNYALAVAGLADAYAFDYIQWRKAEPTARKALELDGALGQAHATMGFVRWFWLWDWAEADREFKLAIALSPNYATAHQWYAGYLTSRYYLREARDEMRRALELEPFSLSINADMAQVLYFTGDLDGAIQQGQQTLALDQDFLNAHLYLYQAYTLKGMYDEAVAEYFKAQEMLNKEPTFHGENEKTLRAAYAQNGIQGFWREKLRTDEPYPEGVKDPYQRAEYYALLGEKDQSVNVLAEAIKRRDPKAVFARVNPMFKNLYDHPRFRPLMEQVDKVAQKKS